MADRKRMIRRRSCSRSRSQSRPIRNERPRSPVRSSRRPTTSIRLVEREKALPPPEPVEAGKKPLPPNIVRAAVVGSGEDAKYMVKVDGAETEITTPFFCMLCHAQCHSGAIHSHIASKKHTKRLQYEDDNWEEASTASARPNSLESVKFVPGGQLHFSPATGSLPYVTGEQQEANYPVMNPPAAPPWMPPPPQMQPVQHQLHFANSWSVPSGSAAGVPQEHVRPSPPKVIFMPTPPPVPATAVTNNQKFKQFLDTEGKTMIENIVLDVLVRYGFTGAASTSTSSNLQQHPRVPLPPRPNKPW